MRSFIGLLAILCICRSHCFPHAPEIRSPDALAVNSSLSSSKHNHSALLASGIGRIDASSSVTESAIVCFPRSWIRPVTNVAGCRPTLREIATFPDRYKKQEFVMHKKPKQPYPPPFGFHHHDSNCTVEIYAQYLVADKFSWEEARRLAQDILQECDEQGPSAGGRSSIGRHVGWFVAVHGNTPHSQEFALLDNSEQIPDGTYLDEYS